MRQKVLILASLIGICGFFIYLSCCDDCPTCPSEPMIGSYYVYISNQYQCYHDYIWIIDSRTDSLIDSIATPADDQVGIAGITPDGKYLVITSSLEGSLLICDVDTKEIVNRIYPTQHVLFPPGKSYMLAFRDGIAKYSIEDWSLIDSDTTPAGYWGGLFNSMSYFYGVNISNEFIIYDYEAMSVVKIDTLKRIDGSMPLEYYTELSSDDRYFYFLSSPNQVFKYDIEAGYIIDSIFISYGGYHGGLKCTPDGRYILLTEASSDFDYKNIGNLVLIDQASFTIDRRISTLGLNPFYPPGEALPVYGIGITPDSRRVYCSTIGPYISFDLTDLRASLIPELSSDCMGKGLAIGKQID